jgi:SAM-dependent methyltransferase
MAAVTSVEAGEAVLVRRAIFLHQDGVMLATTAVGMEAVGVLRPALTGPASVSELMPAITGSGFGYLRVGLRCMASQGWIDLDLTGDPKTTIVGTTDAGRALVPYLDRYLEAGEFLNLFGDASTGAWARPWATRQLESFSDLTERAAAGWGLGDLGEAEQDVAAAHLDGAVAVPAMLFLQATEAVGEQGPALPDDRFGRAAAGLLEHLGWLADGERWTAAGKRARVTARNYGLVGSYLPVLSQLPSLYRGQRVVAGSLAQPEAEWHVQRELNVIASGAAHGRYFADADEVFVELFDREPVSQQPRFVADMGCGDGSWLVRIHDLIRERTVRGRHLDEAPLLMVGFDFNQAALERARQALDRAGIPALVLPGDVSYPDRVRDSLTEHGIAIEDGLHVRSFIDHDRDYLGGDPSIQATGWPSGAYLDRDGHPLGGDAVERDLVTHLNRWAPYVPRHGLVVLEAHAVPPQVARRHVGALHSIAFEGYHGYSHQYPVEYPVFVRACRQAGLEPVTHCERHYPTSRPFVAVSLNRFVVTASDDPLPAQGPGLPREDTWRPPTGEDLEDGQALHRLLFVDGDLRHPRLWCSAPTGWLVAGALEAIESRLGDAEPGDAIRVLDYGTGTGLAAIELLKACRERGLEQRLERRQVSLEVHLADLPGSWFTQGHSLLGDCAWTRFHSLRDERGGFRPLLEVTGGRQMDVILASMVFHLVPDRALARLSGELESALAPGGRLLWNAPDLAPAGRYAVLFHDPNRALRRRWLELLDDPDASTDGAAAAVPEPVLEPLRRARGAGPELRAESGARADRRVLPVPNSADAVCDAIGERLAGEVERRAYEMLRQDFVDALLVPSNLDEYLPEIDDRDARQALVGWLLPEEVLPQMERGPAGTGLGLNVQWTFGAHERPG